EQCALEALAIARVLGEQLLPRRETDADPTRALVGIVERGSVKRGHVDVRVDALVERTVAMPLGEARSLGIGPADRGDGARRRMRARVRFHLLEQGAPDAAPPVFGRHEQL